MAERLLLVRHGETEWSTSHRHTGRTDLCLTPAGERRARALAPVLAGVEGMDTASIATSPLLRARETCRVAGLGDRAVEWPELLEWDYGTAEGRTTASIREEIPGWSVWSHEIVSGETLAAVGARADAAIARVDALDGLVVVFAHAHLLRILGARWCGWPPGGGQHLTLDPATTSLLGYEREARVILRWNALPEAVEQAANLDETPRPASPHV